MKADVESQVYTLRGLRIFVAIFWALVLVFAFTQGGIGAAFAVVVAAICGGIYAVLGLTVKYAKGEIVFKPRDEGDA